MIGPDTLSLLLQGLAHVTAQSLVMMVVALVLLYLGIAKGYEPLLLLPIGAGCLLATLPLSPLIAEDGMLRVLYDIYDGNNEPFDNFGVGLGPITDVLTGPQKNTDAMTTLASFVAALKAQPGVNASTLNALLARYQIGPITSVYGDGDDGLRGMYTDAPLPFSGNIGLGGGNSPNSWEQNQYYVFTGTGGTVTVSATSTQDVSIAAYRRGAKLGAADMNLTGTERFTFSSQAGQVYVVVLTGYGATAGNYDVTVTIQ